MGGLACIGLVAVVRSYLDARIHRWRLAAVLGRFGPIELTRFTAGRETFRRSNRTVWIRREALTTTGTTLTH